MQSGTLKVGPDTRRKAAEMLPGDKAAMEIDIRTMYDLPPLTKKKHESDYHRFCAFICPKCRYFEICGCREHDQALSQEKGNGHAVCSECVKTIPNPFYQTATDTGSPWNHACRNCEEVPAEVNFWLFHDLVSELTVRALYMEVLAQDNEEPDGNNKLTGEFIINSVGFHCQECLTATIPVVNGRFARLYNGHIISAEDAHKIDLELSATAGDEKDAAGQSVNGLKYKIDGISTTGDLPDAYRDHVYLMEDFHFEHYDKTCKGVVKQVPIYLSKGETLYGSTAVIQTPRLPLDRSHAVKFKRPSEWVTNPSVEQLTLLHSHIGRDIPETNDFALQNIDFPYPIWFHKGFIGQFGDAYLRDSDLEGGSSRHAALFVSKYARTILNNVSLFREFLPLWADDDLKWIGEVTHLIEDALTACSEWERISYLPDVCKLDMAREKRWLEAQRKQRDEEEQAAAAAAASDADTDTKSKLPNTVHDFSPDEVETEDTFIDSDYELDDEEDGEPLPIFNLDLEADDYRFLHDAQLASATGPTHLHIPTRKERCLAKAARNHVERLKSLAVGEYMIFYGGYARVHTGHVVVNIMTRTGDSTYSLAISNSGNGVDFHPTTLTDLQKVKTKLTVSIVDIPTDRALSLPFWLMYIRMIVYRSDDHQMEMLYRHLHSWIAGKPLKPAFNNLDPAAVWRTPQRSGVCYYKCITESFRYLLAQRVMKKYDAIYQLHTTGGSSHEQHGDSEATPVVANPRLKMYQEQKMSLTSESISDPAVPLYKLIPATTTQEAPLTAPTLAYRQWKQFSFALRYAILLDVNHDLFVNKHHLYPNARRLSPLHILSSGEITLIRLAPKLVLHHLLKRVQKGDYPLRVIDRVLFSVQQFECYLHGYWQNVPISARHLLAPAHQTPSDIQNTTANQDDTELLVPELQSTKSIDYVRIHPPTQSNGDAAGGPLDESSQAIMPSLIESIDDEFTGPSSIMSNDLICSMILERQNSLEQVISQVSSTYSPETHIGEQPSLMQAPSLSQFARSPSIFHDSAEAMATESLTNDVDCDLLVPSHGCAHIIPEDDIDEYDTSHAEVLKVHDREASILPPTLDLEPQIHPFGALFAGYQGIHHASVTSTEELLKAYGGTETPIEHADFPNLCRNQVLDNAVIPKPTQQAVGGSDTSSSGSVTAGGASVAQPIVETVLANSDHLRYNDIDQAKRHDEGDLSSAVEVKNTGVNSAAVLLAQNRLFGLEYEDFHLKEQYRDIPMDVLRTLLIKRSAVIQQIQNLYRDTQGLFMLQTEHGHTIALHEMLRAIPMIPLPLTLRERGMNLLNPTSFRQIQSSLTSTDSDQEKKLREMNERLQTLALDASGNITQAPDADADDDDNKTTTTTDSSKVGGFGGLALQEQLPPTTTDQGDASTSTSSEAGSVDTTRDTGEEKAMKGDDSNNEDDSNDDVKESEPIESITKTLEELSNVYTTLSGTASTSDEKPAYPLCLWQDLPLSRSQQQFLVGALRSLMAALMTATFSLDCSVQQQAQVIVAATAILAIIDAVIRVQPTIGENPVGLVLEGGIPPSDRLTLGPLDKSIYKYPILSIDLHGPQEVGIDTLLAMFPVIAPEYNIVRAHALAYLKERFVRSDAQVFHISPALHWTQNIASTDPSLQFVRDIATEAGLTIDRLVSKAGGDMSGECNEVEAVGRWYCSCNDFDSVGHAKLLTPMACNYPEFADYRDSVYAWKLLLLPQSKRSQCIPTKLYNEKASHMTWSNFSTGAGKTRLAVFMRVFRAVDPISYLLPGPEKITRLADPSTPDFYLGTAKNNPILSDAISQQLKVVYTPDNVLSLAVPNAFRVVVKHEEEPGSGRSIESDEWATSKAGMGGTQVGGGDAGGLSAVTTPQVEDSTRNWLTVDELQLAAQFITSLSCDNHQLAFSSLPETATSVNRVQLAAATPCDDGSAEFSTAGYRSTTPSSSLGKSHSTTKVHLPNLLLYPQADLDPFHPSPYTETQVLAAPVLPSFNSFLSVEHSERLLTLLTQPFTRIPLVLAYMARNVRSNWLQHRAIREMLYHVLLLPNRYVSHVAYNLYQGAVVPVPEMLLGTVYGSLSHEILINSDNVVHPLIILLKETLRMYFPSAQQQQQQQTHHSGTSFGQQQQLLQSDEAGAIALPSFARQSTIGVDLSPLSSSDETEFPLFLCYANRIPAENLAVVLFLTRMLVVVESYVIHSAAQIQERLSTLDMLRATSSLSKDEQRRQTLLGIAPLRVQTNIGSVSFPFTFTDVVPLVPSDGTDELDTQLDTTLATVTELDIEYNNLCKVRNSLQQQRLRIREVLMKVMLPFYLGYLQLFSNDDGMNSASSGDQITSEKGTNTSSGGYAYQHQLLCLHASVLSLFKNHPMNYTSVCSLTTTVGCSPQQMTVLLCSLLYLRIWTPGDSSSASADGKPSGSVKISVSKEADGLNNKAIQGSRRETSLTAGASGHDDTSTVLFGIPLQDDTVTDMDGDLQEDWTTCLYLPDEALQQSTALRIPIDHWLTEGFKHTAINSRATDQFLYEGGDADRANTDPSSLTVSDYVLSIAKHSIHGDIYSDPGDDKSQPNDHGRTDVVLSRHASSSSAHDLLDATTVSAHPDSVDGTLTVHTSTTIQGRVGADHPHQIHALPIGSTHISQYTGSSFTPISLPVHIAITKWKRDGNHYTSDITKLSLSSFTVSSFGSTISPLPSKVTRFTTVSLEQSHTTVLASTLRSMENVTHYKLLDSSNDVYHWSEHRSSEYLPLAPRAIAKVEHDEIERLEGKGIPSRDIEMKCNEVTKAASEAALVVSVDSSTTAETSPDPLSDDADTTPRETDFLSNIEQIESYGIYFNGVYYSRRFGSTPLEEHETWAGFLINMTLYDNYFRLIELEYSWFLPTETIDKGAEYVTAIGFDHLAQSWRFLLVSKPTRLVQMYSFVEHGRCIYPLLIYTSDSAWSLSSFSQELISNLTMASLSEASEEHSMNQRYKSGRRSNFSRNAIGSVTPSVVADGSVSLLRQAHSLAYLVQYYLNQSLDSLAIAPGSPYMALTSNIVLHQHSILFPPQNSVEIFIPPHLLTGLLPDVLLASFTFYLSCGDGIVRGLPQKHRYSFSHQHGGKNVARTIPQADPELNFLLLIRLVDLGQNSSVGESDCSQSIGNILKNAHTLLSSHSALVYSIPLDPQTSLPVCASPPKLLVNPLNLVEFQTKSTSSVAALPSAARSATGQESFLQSTSNLYRLLTVLTRLDDLSHTLVWATPTDALDITPSLGFMTSPASGSSFRSLSLASSASLPSSSNSTMDLTPPVFTPLCDLPVDTTFLSPSAPLLLSHVQLIRLGLCFVVQSDTTGKARLFDRDQPDLFISDLRPRMKSFITLFNGIPHSVLLQNSRHDLYILVPNYPVRHNQLARSFPLDTTLLMQRHHQRWLKTCSVRYYVYRVHPSLSSLQLLSAGGVGSGSSNSGSGLAPLFYLFLLRMLNRDYVTASNILELCFVSGGTIFDTEEQFMYKLIQETLSDKHPDATAIRLRFVHRFQSVTNAPVWEYSSLEKGKGNEAGKPYDLSDDYIEFATRFHHVSTVCTIPLIVEYNILQKVNDVLGNNITYVLRSFYLTTLIGITMTVKRRKDQVGSHGSMLNDHIVEACHTPCYKLVFPPGHINPTTDALEQTAVYTIEKPHIGQGIEWSFFDEEQFPSSLPTSVFQITGEERVDYSVLNQKSPVAAVSHIKPPVSNETGDESSPSTNDDDDSDENDNKNDDNTSDSSDSITTPVDTSVFAEKSEQPQPAKNVDTISPQQKLLIRIETNDPVLQDFVRISSDHLFDIISGAPVHLIHRRLLSYLNPSKSHDGSVHPSHHIGDKKTADQDIDCTSPESLVPTINDIFNATTIYDEGGFKLLSALRETRLREGVLSPAQVTTTTKTARDALMRGVDYLHDFITNLLSPYLNQLWNTTTDVPWTGTTIYERPKRAYMRGARLAWLTNRIMRDSIDGSSSRLGFLFLLDLFTGTRPIDTEWDDEAKRVEYRRLVNDRIQQGLTPDPKWQLELLPPGQLQSLKTAPKKELTYDMVSTSQSTHFSFLLVYWLWMHVSNMDTLRTITVNQFPYLMFSVLYEALLLYRLFKDQVEKGTKTGTTFDQWTRAKWEQNIGNLPSLSHMMFPFTRFQQRLRKITQFQVKESPLQHYLCQVAKYLHEYKHQQIEYDVSDEHYVHTVPIAFSPQLNPHGLSSLVLAAHTALPPPRLPFVQDRLLNRRYVASTSFFDDEADSIALPAPLLSSTDEDLYKLGVMPLFDIAKSYVKSQTGATIPAVSDREHDDHAMLQNMISTLESHPSLQTKHASRMIERLHVDNSDYHVAVNTGNVVSLSFNHIIERTVNQRLPPSENELVEIMVQLDRLLQDIIRLVPDDRQFCDAVQQWVVRKVNYVPTVSQEAIDGDLFNNQVLLYQLLTATQHPSIHSKELFPPGSGSIDQLRTISAAFDEELQYSTRYPGGKTKRVHSSLVESASSAFRSLISTQSSTTHISRSVFYPGLDPLRAYQYIRIHAVQKALPMAIKMIQPIFTLLAKFNDYYYNRNAVLLDKYTSVDESNPSLEQRILSLAPPPPILSDFYTPPDQLPQPMHSLNQLVAHDIFSVVMYLQLYARSSPLRPYGDNSHVSTGESLNTGSTLSYPLKSTEMFLGAIKQLLMSAKSQSTLTQKNTKDEQSDFKHLFRLKRQYAAHRAALRRLRKMLQLLIRNRDDPSALSIEESGEVLMIQSMSLSYYEASHIDANTLFSPSALPPNAHYQWLLQSYLHVKSTIVDIKDEFAACTLRVKSISDALRKRALGIARRNRLLSILVSHWIIPRISKLFAASQLHPAVEIDQLNRRQHLVGRYIGLSKHITLHDILVSYVDTTSISDNNRNILHHNPFYTDNDQVYAALTMYMLRTIRITQSYRVIVHARSLCKAISQWRHHLASIDSSPALAHTGVGSLRWILSIREQFKTLATTLTEQRFYIDRVRLPRWLASPYANTQEQEPSEVLAIEPRLLLFEYEHGIMLRDQQSDLVRTLLSTKPTYEEQEVVVDQSPASDTTTLESNELKLPQIKTLQCESVDMFFNRNNAAATQSLSQPVSISSRVVAIPSHFLHYCHELDSTTALCNKLLGTDAYEVRFDAVENPTSPGGVVIRPYMTRSSLPEIASSVRRDIEGDIRNLMPTTKDSSVLAPGQLNYLYTRVKSSTIVFELTIGCDLPKPLAPTKPFSALTYLQELPRPAWDTNWHSASSMVLYFIRACKVSSYNRTIVPQLLPSSITPLDPQENSSVHQLIMGSGKSAVVSPLLSIGTASDSGFIVNIVPQTLVNMSLNIQRASLTGTFGAPVYLLDFSRDLGGGLSVGIKEDPSDITGVQCSLTDLLVKARGAEHAFNSASILYTNVESNTLYFSKLKRQMLERNEKDDTSEKESDGQVSSPSSPNSKLLTSVKDFDTVIRHHAEILQELQEEFPQINENEWYSELRNEYLEQIKEMLVDLSNRNGVLVTTDASLKSLMLKPMECVLTARKMLLHLLNSSTPYSNQLVGEVYLQMTLEDGETEITEEVITKFIKTQVGDAYDPDDHMGHYKAIARPLFQRFPYTCLQIDTLVTSAAAMSAILSRFYSSPAILDEVDTLLNPLKSELNFPIGERTLLQPRLRWDMPIVFFHFIQLAFTLAQSTSAAVSAATASGALPTSVLLAQSSFDLSNALKRLQTSVCHTILLSSNGQQLLVDLAMVLSRGCHDNSLITQPHLVLVDVEYYKHYMLPILANMIHLWLRCAGVPFPDYHNQPVHHHPHRDENDGSIVYLPCIHQNPIDCYLSSPSINEKHAPGSLINGAIAPSSLELLNLGRNWLHTYLPHVLSKIVRVHYGLLSSQYIQRHTSSDAPKSRLLSAVPFIGKDTPSPSSEFAHADILAGLTLIAYTQQGLRLSDTVTLVSRLKDILSSELGPEHTRPSSILFSTWLEQAYQAESDEIDRSQLEHDDTTAASSTTSSSYHLTLGALQIGDRLQIRTIHKLLRHHPPVIHYYLTQVVYHQILASPSESLTMNGHDLAALPFQRYICFSGTPTSLLPPNLNQCQFQPLAEAEMTRTIASPRVATVRHLPRQWTIYDLLRTAAHGNYNAFIDAGALVTGYSTAAVCALLLSIGLPHIDAAVFLNQEDEAMALLRKPMNGRHLVPLRECNVALERRFVFYDHAHTVGVDIAHCVDAIALVTVGKDSTFRDVAQAVYRMRGIGKGQTIHLLVVHEIANLIHQEMVLPHHHQHLLPSSSTSSSSTAAADEVSLSKEDDHPAHDSVIATDDHYDTITSGLPALSTSSTVIIPAHDDYDDSAGITQSLDQSQVLSYLAPSTIVQWLLTRGNIQERREMIQHAGYVSVITPRENVYLRFHMAMKFILPMADTEAILPMLFSMSDVDYIYRLIRLFTRQHDNSVPQTLDIGISAQGSIDLNFVKALEMFMELHSIRPQPNHMFERFLRTSIHLRQVSSDILDSIQNSVAISHVADDDGESEPEEAEDAGNNAADIHDADTSEPSTHVTSDVAEENVTPDVVEENEISTTHESTPADSLSQNEESAPDAQDEKPDEEAPGEEPVPDSKAESLSKETDNKIILDGPLGDGIHRVEHYTPISATTGITFTHLDSECVHEQEIEIQQQVQVVQQEGGYTTYISDRNITPWAVLDETILPHSTYQLSAQGADGNGNDNTSDEQIDPQSELTILLQSYCSTLDDNLPQTGSLSTGTKLLHMLYCYILMQRDLGIMVSIKTVPAYEGAPHPLSLLRQYNSFERFIFHCLYASLPRGDSIGDLFTGKTTTNNTNEASTKKSAKKKSKGKDKASQAGGLAGIILASNIYPLSSVALPTTSIPFPRSLYTTRAFHPVIPQADQLRLRNTHIVCEVHQFLGFAKPRAGLALSSGGSIQSTLSLDIRLELQMVLNILKLLSETSSSSVPATANIDGEESAASLLPRELCVSILNASGLGHIARFIPSDQDHLHPSDIERVFAKSITSIHSTLSYDDFTTPNADGVTPLSSKWDTRMVLLTMYEAASLRRVLLSPTIYSRITQPCVIILRDTYTGQPLHRWNNLSVFNPAYRSYISEYKNSLAPTPHPLVPSTQSILTARNQWPTQWQGLALRELVRWYDGQTYFVPSSTAAVLAAIPDIASTIKAKATHMFLLAHRRVSNVAQHTPLETILATRSHVSLMLYHTILYALFHGLTHSGTDKSKQAADVDRGTSPQQRSSPTLLKSAELFTLLDSSNRGFVDEATLSLAIQRYIPVPSLATNASFASNIMRFIVPSTTSLSFTLGDFAEWLSSMQDKYSQRA